MIIKGMVPKFPVPRNYGNIILFSTLFITSLHKVVENFIEKRTLVLENCDPLLLSLLKPNDPWTLGVV